MWEFNKITIIRVLTIDEIFIKLKNSTSVNDKQGVSILCSDLKKKNRMFATRIWSGLSKKTENAKRDAEKETLIENKLKSLGFNIQGINALSQYLRSEEWVCHQESLYQELKSIEIWMTITREKTGEMVWITLRSPKWNNQITPQKLCDQMWNSGKVKDKKWIGLLSVDLADSREGIYTKRLVSNKILTVFALEPSQYVIRDQNKETSIVKILRDNGFDQRWINALCTYLRSNKWVWYQKMLYNALKRLISIRKST